MFSFFNTMLTIILIVPVFLFAIILHEVAHGVAALAQGDDTARRAGRLTLNPLPHIDPLGALFFLISMIGGVGFGWAKPVPVNFSYMRNPRRGMIIVSLAGPAANILLALICALLYRTAFFLGAGLPDILAMLLTEVMKIGVTINLMLAAFNLLPVPPLDGSKVLMGLLPYRQAYGLSRLEPYGFIILLALIWFKAISLLANTVVFPLANILLPAYF